MAGFDFCGHVHQLAHVRLAGADKVGQVQPVAFVEQVFIAVVGIFEDRQNGYRVGILFASDADKAVLALVVPAMTFHATPGVRCSHPHLLGLEGGIGLIGNARF